MPPYYLVKLTRMDKEGKSNPCARTYGLMEITLAPPNKLTGYQNMSSHLIITDKNPRNLGIYYGNMVADSYNPSDASLSFKPPFDIVPGKGGKDPQIYKADDFPDKLKPRFIRGMLEEITGKVPIVANGSIPAPRDFVLGCPSKA